jgi:hypothetical protein
MQLTLTQEQLRNIGIALNKNQCYGWIQNLSNLSKISPMTIRRWHENSEEKCTGFYAIWLQMLLKIKG